MIKIFILLIFYCFTTKGAIVSEKTTSPSDSKWRLGARLGFTHRFIRPNFSNWKVKSSSLTTVGLDHTSKLESLKELRIHYGIEVSNIYQLAEFEKTEIKISGTTLNVPLGIGYIFLDGQLEVGVRLNTPIFNVKAVQAVFSTPTYNKSIKNIQSSNLFKIELYTEYQFSNELRYILSYNFDYSAIYLGGIYYAF